MNARPKFRPRTRSKGMYLLDSTTLIRNTLNIYFSCFEPGGILDSQIDSQIWLERSFAAPSSSPTVVQPATPNHKQKPVFSTTTSPSSPFTLHVPDGHTPRRFTAQNIPAEWQPGGSKEFTYEELNWLTEFYLRTNALLTKEMVRLHVRLHRAEDMARGFRQFIDEHIVKKSSL